MHEFQKRIGAAFANGTLRIGEDEGDIQVAHDEDCLWPNKTCDCNPEITVFPNGRSPFQIDAKGERIKYRHLN